MAYYHGFISAAVLTVCLLAGGCGLAEEGPGRPDVLQAEKAPVTSREHRETAIGKIWNHPNHYEGRKVLLRGRFQGWRGQATPPGITRSDWAIGDDTGAIYVAGSPPGGLDPYRDIGRPLEVLGTVRLNEKSVPYIRIENVVIPEAR